MSTATLGATECASVRECGWLVNWRRGGTARTSTLKSLFQALTSCSRGISRDDRRRRSSAVRLHRGSARRHGPAGAQGQRLSGRRGLELRLYRRALHVSGRHLEGPGRRLVGSVRPAAEDEGGADLRRAAGDPRSPARCAAGWNRGDELERATREGRGRRTVTEAI